jgi:hypothetical protein
MYVRFTDLLLTWLSEIRKWLGLMENVNMNDADQKQRDKRFHLIALAVFLPLAAVLKVYFFLR